MRLVWILGREARFLRRWCDELLSSDSCIIVMVFIDAIILPIPSPRSMIYGTKHIDTIVDFISFPSTTTPTLSPALYLVEREPVGYRDGYH